MDKDKIIGKLKKYNYKYKLTEKKISVNLGLGLFCEVFFLEKGIYKIGSRLKIWNFLTGMISLNIKQSIIYNSLILLFMVGLQIYFDTVIRYPYIPFIVVLMFLIWYLFYLIKYYTFKSTLIGWIED